MDRQNRLFISSRVARRLALATAVLLVVVAGPGAERAAAQDCAGAAYAPIGTPVQGVARGETALYFMFEVTEAGWFRISTSGTADTVGVLLDGGCRPLADDDDGGEGVNFSIERQLSEGTYFISVRGFDEESGGAFALMIQPVAGETGGCEEADPVTVGLPVSGSLAGDTNLFYRFSVSERGRYVVYTTGSADTLGALLDANCSPLAEDDDSGADNNFQIEHQLGPGTYHVRARGYDATARGPFTLHVEAGGAGRGGCAEAAEADPLRGVSGTLDGRTPQFYRFVVDAAARYRIFTSSDADTVGTLYGPDCDEIAEDDDGGDDMDFRIDHSLAPGTYYVAVRGYDDSAQSDYYLQFEILGSADECAAAPVLEVGFAGSQSMTEGAREYFAFVVDGPGTYVVTTFGDLDTMGILLDENCGEMEENDDGGRDVNFLIRRNLEPGTYYVAVEGYDDMESGYYELLITLESGASADCQGAQTVAIGETAYGSVVGTSPYFYRFDIAQPGRYRVGSSGDADTMGSLHNSDCAEITSDDDGGSDLNFRITRQLAAGTYYVSVRGYDEETYGDYTLEIAPLSVQEADPQVSAEAEAEGEPEAALRRTAEQYFQAMRAFDSERVAAMLTGSARSSYESWLDAVEDDPLRLEDERERAAGLTWEVVRITILSTAAEAAVATRVTVGGNQRSMVMIWRLEGENWKLAETRAR